MKIAIMAAGAVSGYFGARLAGAGHEVHFLARGKHLEAIRAGGLRVKSDFGDMHLTSVSVSDDPSQVGPVDVILFAVKLWDTAAAARACKPMLGEDTAVISLQNGVESTGIIAEELGPEHALGGSAYISASIAEPGVIHHFGSFAKLVFLAKAITENQSGCLPFWAPARKAASRLKFPMTCRLPFGSNS